MKRVLGSNRPSSACAANAAKCQTLLTIRAMTSVLITISLLALSNLFMAFAWYGHLKHVGNTPLYMAILLSWGIAFFEYCLQVPANRVGFTIMSVPQLKILQEVISLGVFVPFAVFYLNAEFKLDYLWAALCILGAVYFAFRPSM
jgi:uncharacterized protein (DUF486 family)